MCEVERVDASAIVTLVAYDIVITGDQRVASPVYQLIGINLFALDCDTLRSSLRSL